MVCFLFLFVSVTLDTYLCQCFCSQLPLNCLWVKLIAEVLFVQDAHGVNLRCPVLTGRIGYHRTCSFPGVKSALADKGASATFSLRAVAGCL